MTSAKHRARAKEMGCCCQPCFYAPPQQQESEQGEAAGLRIPRELGLGAAGCALLLGKPWLYEQEESVPSAPWALALGWFKHQG